MELAIEVVGWASALLILGAYVLVSSGRLTGQSALFQSMNAAGAAGFVVNTSWHGAVPSATLNVVWCLIALWSLWRIGRGSGVQPG